MLAELQNISQSALSKQIRSLEQEIGDVTLIDRGKRPVELTPAGKEFFRRAEMLLLAYDDMIAAMKTYPNKKRPSLRVGVYPVLSFSEIMTVINMFSKQNENTVDTEIIDRESAMLKKMLLENNLDVAFLTYSPYNPMPPELSFIKLAQHNLCLAVNKNNPISKCDSVVFENLSDMTVFLIESSEAICSICSEECKKSGINPHIQKFRYVNTMLEMISANRGVGLISVELSKNNPVDDIQYIPFENPLYFDVIVACHKQSLSSKWVKSFIDYILSENEKLT